MSPSRKNYKEDRIVWILKPHRDILVSRGGKLIQVLKDGAIGIKAWGKIDFLCNSCGYRRIVVNKLG